jgi:DNA-binding LacI/PurR family transcriptional regulator
MVQKKVYTMQDIANEVGVSKATVSYVLNNKKGARVSDATRKKILQVANLYNYVPNISARTLSQSQSKLIGVLINEKKEKYLRLDDNEFLNCLKNSFFALDYNMVFIRNREHFDYIDLAYNAIIAINYDNEKINKIADSTFSPLILIDSINENFLFYKIHNDYSQAIKLALTSYNNQDNCILVYDKFNNEKMNQLLSSHSNSIEEYTYQDKNDLIELFRKNKYKNYIIIGEALGFLAEQYLLEEQFVVICVDKPIILKSTTKTIYFSNKYKAEVVSEITDNLVKKMYEIYDSHEVKLKYISNNL